MLLGVGGDSVIADERFCVLCCAVLCCAVLCVVCVFIVCVLCVFSDVCILCSVCY